MFSCTNNKEEETACYKLYLKQRSCKGNKEMAENIPFPSLQINVCSAHENHSLEAPPLHTAGRIPHCLVPTLKMKKGRNSRFGDEGVVRQNLSQRDKNVPPEKNKWRQLCNVDKTFDLPCVEESEEYFSFFFIVIYIVVNSRLSVVIVGRRTRITQNHG